MPKMKFALMPLDLQGTIIFPVNPPEVNVDTGTNVHTFNLAAGDILELPRGVKPRIIQWSSFFPPPGPEEGRGIPYLSDVAYWDPSQYVEQIEQWQKERERLILSVAPGLLSESLLVFVNRFAYSAVGGRVDEISYTIELREYREIIVRTAEEVDISRYVANKRPEPRPPREETIRPGDTWQLIAKRTLGDSERWRDVWALNRENYGWNTGEDALVERDGETVFIPEE